MKLNVMAAIAVTTIALSAHPLIARAAPPPPSMQAGGSGAPPTLTPNQKARLSALTKQMQAARNALIANKSMTDKQKQAKYLQLMKAFDSNMMAILTPAERRQVAVDFAQREAYAKQRQAEIDALTPAQRAQLQADYERRKAISDKITNSMSPQQKQAMQALISSTNSEASAVINNTALSQSDKQSRLMDLRKESAQKMHDILTPAQQADLQQLQSMSEPAQK